MKPITHENLIEAGWRKLGGAYYGNNNKRLTNFENAWQIWQEGKSITVQTMDQL